MQQCTHCHLLHDILYITIHHHMIKKHAYTVNGDPRLYKGRRLSVNCFLCPQPNYTLQEPKAINMDLQIVRHCTYFFPRLPYALTLDAQTYITVQFAHTFFLPPTNFQLLHDTMHRYLIFSQKLTGSQPHPPPEIKAKDEQTA